MRQRFTLAVLGLAAISASLAFAQTQKDPAKKPTQPTPGTTAAPQNKPEHGEMQLPPGWTEADMQTCMEAGTPGEMHQHLAKSAGVWHGKTTMWMVPGAEPMQSECTSTISVIMDGRFTKCETAGDMPGMGPFTGFGLYGFDNVSEQFQATWIDNCGTGMMTGTGQLSSDGKSMTWKYNTHCPLTKKLVTFRQVDRYTGPNSMTMEMHGVDPKSGKEYKMMEITFTRKPGTAAASAGGTR